MKKPAIPSVPKPGENRSRFDDSIKESLESIMGRRGAKIKLLDPATATTADIANKLNEIIGVLQ